jgi:hypothetical protein
VLGRPSSGHLTKFGLQRFPSLCRLASCAGPPPLEGRHGKGIITGSKVKLPFTAGDEALTGLTFHESVSEELLCVLRVRVCLAAFGLSRVALCCEPAAVVERTLVQLAKPFQILVFNP